MFWITNPKVKLTNNVAVGGVSLDKSDKLLESHDDKQCRFFLSGRVAHMLIYAYTDKTGK